MRTFVTAIVILTIMLGSIVGYYFYCENAVSKLQELAVSETLATSSGAEEIYAYWEKHRFALHLGVNTELINNIERYMLALKAAVSSASNENTAEAAELLRYELSELRKTNALSLENIL